MTNEIKIESIRIKKLHGIKDFAVDFEHPFKIFVSENGQGKTTILKIINAILEGQPEKLQTVNFESIEITTNTKKRFYVNKNEIENNFYMEEAHSYKRALKYLERKTTPETLEKIKSITLSSENDSIIKRKISELSKNNVTTQSIRKPL